jgi:hypothetical protein
VRGQAGAGLAVGGVDEVQTGVAAQFADSDIAVQDLLHEEVGGDDGAEIAVAPAVADVAAVLADELLGNGIGDLTLDPFERISDIEPGDLLG